jgi:hypothetical protein
VGEGALRIAAVGSTPTCHPYDVRVRSPGVPDEPSGDDPANQPNGHDWEQPDEFDDESARDAGSGGDAVPRHPDGSVRFGVPTRVLVAKFGAAILVALLSMLAANRPQLVVGLIAAGWLAIYALRDVVARERLRADADGLVTVRGFAGRHRLAWTDVERVRVDARSRLGTTSQLLEVDAGEHIYLYSRFDLGVDPDDAASALESVRTG